MKIGIFGDSFADKRAKENTIWWSILANKYDHDVTSFGESASSLVFSAKKVMARSNQFDLVIWITTAVGRLSLEYDNDSTHHFSIGRTDFAYQDIQNKYEIWKKYWQHVMVWEDEKLMGRALVEMVQNRCNNLLILPGFSDPMDSTFNLFRVFQREVEMLYDGVFSDAFYEDYADSRVGHLSNQSHEILAGLLSHNLCPGTFTADIDLFPRYLNPDFVIKNK
jgi:hypothetical protein